MSLLIQPNASVPVTVYRVVMSGVATGVAVLGLFNVPAGAQLYAAAPDADNWLCRMLQSISLDFAAFITGDGLTVIVVERLPTLLQSVSVICTE